LAQRAVNVASLEAFVPFGGFGCGGIGLSTSISRSITGAELPAGSITLTTRWWAPLLTAVVSNGTSTLSAGGHGCR
jgi:hypothetical protein